MPDISTLTNDERPAELRKSLSTSIRQPKSTAEFGNYGEEVCKAFEDMFARLNAMTRLEHDWDSYGAEAPSKASISVLRSLIGKVLAEFSFLGLKAIPFMVAPNPDGGVLAEWRNDSRLIEVIVNPDQILSYFMKLGDHREEEHGIAEAAILKCIASVVH
jgi:hypothetical protein